MVLPRLIALSFFVSLCVGLPSDWTGPCPFNEACTCQHIHEQPPNVFFHITCGPNFPQMPIFDAPNGSLGASVINISGDVSTIPAGAFAPFEFIYFLHITQQPAPAANKWHAEAFADSEIEELHITNVMGLLPPPPALKVLGPVTYTLRINAGGASELGPNAFSEFTRLEYLWIDGTPISKIHDTAFVGLKRIKRLQLTSGTISEYPRNALKQLRYINDLVDLSDNRLTGFQQRDFSIFPKLGALYLSGNNLTNAVESGALDKLPPKLAILQLANGSLKAVPTRVLSLSPYIGYLDLSGNEITSLKYGDFTPPFQMMELNLHANPITNMEKGVFKPLPHLRVLTLGRTRLPTIDLSELDVGLMEIASFDDNPYLKSVTVSGQAPYFLKTLGIRNTSVEKLDPKLDPVMVGWLFNKLDFTNSTKFICDESLGWMPKHTFCPYFPIDITGTTCGNINGKPVIEYLKETFPDPCPQWHHK